MSVEPRTYWQTYVDTSGGVVAVAERLGIPYPTIASVTNGWRGIGRKLAVRMVKADPSLDINQLVWVRPVQSGDQQAA